MTTTTHTPEFHAYYAGRNSWYPGEKIPTVCPYTDKACSDAWKRGLRSILAEERLNADTEWDD